MPELYIGNMSKQIQQFAYRSPERPGVITQIIPIGGQIRVSPNGMHVDLSTPEIDSIISQHRAYGIVPIEEVDKAQSPFSATCYSIGKPITPEKLRKAMLKKEEALEAFGRKLRQEAAIAVNSQIEEAAGGRPLRELEMSFEEVEPKGGYTDDIDHTSEGVLVTRSAQPGAPTPIEIGRRGRR
jgi:hypothetical protein